MATHSSVLAWTIPGTGSLVGCRLWGCTESDMTEATQQQQEAEDLGFKSRWPGWRPSLLLNSSSDPAGGHDAPQGPCRKVEFSQAVLFNMVATNTGGCLNLS